MLKKTNISIFIFLSFFILTKHFQQILVIGVNLIKYLMDSTKTLFTNVNILTNPGV